MPYRQGTALHFCLFSFYLLLLAIRMILFVYFSGSKKCYTCQVVACSESITLVVSPPLTDVSIVSPAKVIKVVM